MISRYESSEREERGARKGGVLRSIRDSRERSQREQARLCRMRNFSLSLCVSLFLFCVAWLCRARLPACLPAWHVYSPGGTVDLPERHQSQRATTGDEAAHIAQPPAAPNQEARKKREKQL